MMEETFIMTEISKAQKERQSSFGFLLQLLARRMDGVMKARLSEIDVDMKIFANLRILAERDGITQRELGRLLDFPEYFTSRNVDLLVEAGFAERRPDPDSRRTVLVYLTKLGRAKAKELPNVVAAANLEFLEPLSKTERQDLIALLHKVARIPTGGDPKL